MHLKRLELAGQIVPSIINMSIPKAGLELVGSSDRLAWRDFIQPCGALQPCEALQVRGRFIMFSETSAQQLQILYE